MIAIRIPLARRLALAVLLAFTAVPVSSRAPQPTAAAANPKAYDEAVKARDAEIAQVNAKYEAAMKK
jgi:hypothetical protein